MFLLLLALLVDVFAAFSSLATELEKRSVSVCPDGRETYHDGAWRQTGTSTVPPNTLTLLYLL